MRWIWKINLFKKKKNYKLNSKKIVAREPREEVLDQLDLFEGKIKEYRKQIKLMEADLSAERTKYESQKWERNGIADDMNELKSR